MVSLRTGAADQKIRAYDFRRPDKFSKDQLRTMQMLHDSYARMVTTVLSSQLRVTAEVSVVSAEQMTYSEYSRKLNNPGVLAVVSLSPLSSNALLEMHPGVAMLLIDRVLGGAGQAKAPNRELTDIEQAVIRRLVTAMVEQLHDGWRNIAEVHPQVESIETNPMFAQIVAPTEICAVVSFSLRIGESAGSLSLCLPYLMMEPVLPRLSAFVWFAGARRKDAPPAGAKVQARLEEAVVELSAELGSAPITIRELLRLVPGDIVPLDRGVGDQLPVRVGDQLAMWARPGTHRGRLALQITKRLEEVRS